MYCGKFHTPPQEKGWIKEYEVKFGGEGCYLALWNEGMNAFTSNAEEVKSFIQEQIDVTEKRVREEILIALSKREADIDGQIRITQDGMPYKHALNGAKAEHAELRSLINNK